MALKSLISLGLQNQSTVSIVNSHCLLHWTTILQTSVHCNTGVKTYTCSVGCTVHIQCIELFHPPQPQASQHDWLVHLFAQVLEWLQCYDDILVAVQDDETGMVGPFSPTETASRRELDAECEFSGQDSTECQGVQWNPS